MDFSSSSTDWFYAFLSGSPMRSDSPKAHINIHNYYNRFSVDFSVAGIAAAVVNPFVDVDASELPVQENPPTNENGDDAVSSGSGLGWAVPLHGIIMSAAFVIAFPVGAVLIRLASFKGHVVVHAGLQTLALVGAIMGAAIGHYVATRGQNQVCQSHAPPVKDFRTEPNSVTAFRDPPGNGPADHGPPCRPTHSGISPPQAIRSTPASYAFRCRTRVVRASSLGNRSY